MLVEWFCDQDEDWHQTYRENMEFSSEKRVSRIVFTFAYSFDLTLDQKQANLHKFTITM